MTGNVISHSKRNYLELANKSRYKGKAMLQKESFGNGRGHGAMKLLISGSTVRARVRPPSRNQRLTHRFEAADEK
jgi:hypothetical protein